MSENMQSLPTMFKDKLDSRKLALELADYEDAKTQAEKRKGELGFLYFAYYFIIWAFSPLTNIYCFYSSPDSSTQKA